MTERVQQLEKTLQDLAAESNYNAAMFFKTGSNSYSAHDHFVSIRNPQLRVLAKQYKDLTLDEIAVLLRSKYNQYRLLGLLILVSQYQKADEQGKKARYQFFLDHIDAVNNWNLVDSCAHLIVGAHIYEGLASEHILQKLVVSASLWHRRIAIIATWYFIRQNSFDLTLQLSEKLLEDSHDLMHKAVGWMLREMGKRDEALLRKFLAQHGDRMPRTMWRYAREKLD